MRLKRLTYFILPTKYIKNLSACQVLIVKNGNTSVIGSGEDGVHLKN